MPGGQNTPDEPSGHRSEVRVVRLSELSVGYTPRQTRVDEDHVMALVEVIDRLPPIIVDERMIVIDGVHRIEASRRAGRREIRAVLFTGDETEALTLAIRANVEHGKPLTRNERRAAARLLLRQHPDRSDRWVAEILWALPRDGRLAAPAHRRRRPRVAHRSRWPTPVSQPRSRSGGGYRDPGEGAGD